MTSALGVIGIISSWNYPLAIPMSQIIPAIAAGNAVICKTSDFTPRCGALIEKLFTDLAGLFREGFSNMFGANKDDDDDELTDDKGKDVEDEDGDDEDDEDKSDESTSRDVGGLCTVW